MLKRPGSKRACRRMARGENYPIARLGGELSAVINRVRRAFGPISMQGPASRPEIRQAEKVVDQTARRLLRGESDLSAWYLALRKYEETWMLQLDQLRSGKSKRCAA